MPVKPGPPDMAAAQPDRLIKHRVSDDGLRAEVLLPSLWYTDFDNRIGGRLPMYTCSKLFELLRYSALDNGFGFYNRLKTADRSIFMASVTYDFARKVNELTYATSWGNHFPLLAKLNIVYVGKSSFAFTIDIHQRGMDEVLMSARLTFVYVDYATRKPAAFPAWVHEAINAKTLGKPEPRLSTPAIPPNAHAYTIRAFASDIDMNGHVNSSIFVKWCTDAGADAALHGHYSSFTDDIGTYPNKQIAVKYIGEGMQGNELVVNTWQDGADRYALHFVITRDCRIIFVAKFTFYPDISVPSAKL